MKPKETDFEPKTLGEHIKHLRVMRVLSQKAVAKLLRVSPDTILNWEKGHTEPPIEAVPAAVRFLGYDPFPEPRSLPARLLAKRREMGWSIREAAQQLGVDEGTWGAWERGETILYRRHRERVAQLLGLPAEEIHREMGAQWNRSQSTTPTGKT